MPSKLAAGRFCLRRDALPSAREHFIRWYDERANGWLADRVAGLAARRIAECVAVHEMAHLHEPHHTPAFWLRVERAMLDCAQGKAWLAEHGIDVEGI